MSKALIVETIKANVEISGVAATRLAGEILGALRDELVKEGRLALPEIGSLTVRERAARSGFNPRTQEKIKIKAGAAIKFRPSVSLKTDAMAGLKKAKRKAAKG
ncbi:HU family DNA-binding protein [Sabulicella glaciei]|nr:HU family DNA-binding protein [Roseococcus sp. MDT2-1-1]